ncbi:KASH domain-containing protein [Trichonephila clavata]|uniref:KASH domain-containing protein n=1 Tax=Trichonephila clavata TaxID=2740835 RepID=A0A8X6LRZ0_TRICU|nr:KASH domain-containing protein [Trichonephila clavata]
MRIVIEALWKCWILFKNHREASDLELDEGPLNKHRRLTLDRWTAVASTPNMDKMRLDGNKRTTNIIKTGLLTKDIGVLCSDLVPVNDKGIMVGTTSIAALKAEYGDDFTNFEIIQDVGYSSESSTHLSSDDGISVGGDRYFNIRVYNYADEKAPSKAISLKDELKKVDPKQPSSLASSVGSSSGATSFNDSGLGAADLLTAAEAISEKCLLGNDSDNFPDLCLPGEESDFLETVLESCVDFCASDGGKEEDANNLGGIDDLQYNLSGMESDDSADNFHNRSSFTTSSQLFYKMILVDSENDEETNGNENNNSHDKTLLNMNITNSSDFSSNSPPETTSDFNENFIKPTEKSQAENKSSSTDSEQETFKAPALNNGSDIGCKRSSFLKSKYLSSTPIPSHERNFTSPNLKRKRDSDSNDFVTIWEGGGGMRVRSWLKRCSKPFDTVPRTSGVRRSLFRSGSGYSSSEDSAKDILSVKLREDLSSCDASGEYTSSSADEGNAMSSSSSFFDDDALHLKERFDSCSGEGSVETVIRGFNSSFRSEVDSGDPPTLLPPPLSSTPSCLRRRQCTVGSLRCCNGPFSSDSCADLRWFVLKASSEGDLRTRSWHVPDVEHSFSNIPTHQRHKENSQGSTFDFKHRLSSSLPNVLRHRSDSSAEDAKGSILSQHSDSKTFKHGSQHDESLTSFVSHNQSSSSDFERRKKRRSRRKSSSSNRSSRSVLTSSDKGRHRSATLTSRCSSRRRNFSQRSDFLEGSENFFSESDNSPAVVNKASREELNLKDELELALEDNLKSCRTSASLLSPAESDVVLTHLEEQSTVSDQVWDGYQDMPYLSEAYSEATVDEDAVRKLTEFGDDYGSAIGQPLRFLDTQDTKPNAPKSPSKKSSKIPSHDNDSDSDLEGLHHVIEEAGKALQLTRATLKRRQSGDFFSSAENAELLATCGTYLHWLQTLCEQIAIEGKENSFSSSDLKELHYLVEEWKILKRSIEMFEELDGDEIKQKYLKAQQNIDALFSKMSELSSLANLRTKDFKSWEDLQENISRLQMVLSTLQDTREQLLAVNLQVHRFVTEYGNDASYKENCLKEDVTELYQKWDDIYERNGTQLTELETLNTAWKNYSETFHALNSKLKEAEHLSSKEICDIECHSFEDEVTCNLLEDLKKLKADAEALRKRLRSTETWKSIQRDLRSLEKRVHTHTRSSPALRSAEHPNSSSVEDDPDDHFEDAIQQMEAYESFHKKSPTHHLDGARKSARTAKKKSSRFWRIIRVAVPVQLTLVLLFCLACYLEPNCCDRLNNFSFSFTPHLRYLRGPPPV